VGPANYCFQHFTVSKHFCVKQDIVSTLAFDIHLLNFPLSTWCSHINMLDSA